MTDKEKYKKELLDKYLSNNLSVDDRHELERLALDDPFLFEAMNGFAKVKEDHSIDIKDLRDRIFSEPSKKKTRSLLPYGIAASLLVVIGLSFSLADFGWQDRRDPMANTTYKADETTVDQSMEVAEVNAKKKVGGNSSEKETVPQLKNAKRHAESKSDRIGELGSVDKEDEIQQTIQTQSSTAFIDGVAIDDVALDDVVLEEEAIEEYQLEPSLVEEIEADLAENVVMDVVDIPEAEKEKAQMNAPMNKSKKVIESRKSELSTVGDYATAPPQVVPAPSGGIQESAVTNTNSEPLFDEYFHRVAKEKFTKKEIRNLNNEVSLSFKIQDGEISNFKVMISQGQQLDSLLLEIVKGGGHHLKTQNAEEIVYEIRSL